MGCRTGVVAGGVYGNSYYGDQPILYRVLALLVLALVAGWIASSDAKRLAISWLW